MSTNEITGDTLISKPTTKEYSKNYDLIFRSKNLDEEDPKDGRCVLHDNEKVDND